MSHRNGDGNSRGFSVRLSQPGTSRRDPPSPRLAIPHGSWGRPACTAGRRVHLGLDQRARVGASDGPDVAVRVGRLAPRRRCRRHSARRGCTIRPRGLTGHRKTRASSFCAGPLGERSTKRWGGGPPQLHLNVGLCPCARVLLSRPGPLGGGGRLRGLGSDRDRGLHRRRDAGLALGSARWPLDLVLDHASLQSVSGDAQKLRSFDDTARLLQGGLTERSLGFSKVQVFQKDRHDTKICEKSLVGKLFIVMSHTDTIEDDAVRASGTVSSTRSLRGRKRPSRGEDEPIVQRPTVSMRDTDRPCALRNPAIRLMREIAQLVIHYPR